MLKVSPFTSATLSDSPDAPAHAANSWLAALSSGVSGVGGLPVHPGGKSDCTRTSFWARAVAAASDPAVVGVDDEVVVGADVVFDDLLPPPPQAASTSAKSGAMRTSRFRTAGNPRRSGSPALDSCDVAALSPRLDHQVVAAGLEEHQLGDVHPEQVIRRGRGVPGLALEGAVEALERLLVGDLHGPARDAGVAVGD